MVKDILSWVYMLAEVTTKVSLAVAMILIVVILIKTIKKIADKE